jgi:hypothetical protein
MSSTTPKSDKKKSFFTGKTSFEIVTAISILDLPLAHKLVLQGYAYNLNPKRGDWNSWPSNPRLQNYFLDDCDESYPSKIKTDLQRWGYITFVRLREGQYGTGEYEINVARILQEANKRHEEAEAIAAEVRNRRMKEGIPSQQIQISQQDNHPEEASGSEPIPTLTCPPNVEGPKNPVSGSEKSGVRVRKIRCQGPKNPVSGSEYSRTKQSKGNTTIETEQENKKKKDAAPGFSAQESSSAPSVLSAESLAGQRAEASDGGSSPHVGRLKGKLEDHCNVAVASIPDDVRKRIDQHTTVRGLDVYENNELRSRPDYPLIRPYLRARMSELADKKVETLKAALKLIKPPTQDTETPAPVTKQPIQPPTQSPVTQQQQSAPVKPAPKVPDWYANVPAELRERMDSFSTREELVNWFNFSPEVREYMVNGKHRAELRGYYDISSVRIERATKARQAQVAAESAQAPTEAAA